jgi:hypothetical protein
MINFNNINWGNIYCSSWFGDTANESTLHIASQPECFYTE